MNNVLLVAIGGAAGSLARYGVQKFGNLHFPFGTLAANIAGCFLIGCFRAASTRSLSEGMRLLLMTGFCGGFTTFSAFTFESMQMLTVGRWAPFFLYTFASVAGGLLATFLGYKIFST